MKRYMTVVALLFPLSALSGQNIIQDTIDYGRVLRLAPISGATNAQQASRSESVRQPGGYEIAPENPGQRTTITMNRELNEYVKAHKVVTVE